MIRFLLILLTGIAGSLFLFPISFPFAPTANSKMALAVLGAVFFVFDKARHRSPVISADFLILCLISICVSIWAFLATVINDTTDYAFATYIISVLVWFGAAYAFIRMISLTHKRIDLKLVSEYLLAVCVFQCLLAYAMDLYPWLKQFVDRTMGYSESYLEYLNGRLYGVGAALDPAGLRFSGVLVLTAYLIGNNDFKASPLRGVVYILSFFIVSVFGNMIARSATIGMLVAVVYLVFISFFEDKRRIRSLWMVTAPVVALLVMAGIWLYGYSNVFRSDLRFGFEGFFSLAEKGRWEVHSNEILKTMVVWPEKLSTWIVGDGYFGSPEDIPDSLGQVYRGFYMKTDIGYLRYIFYFGVPGLAGMLAVFVQMTVSCIRSFGKNTLLFLGLLLANVIGWFKVSSDIIMVFAPLVLLAYMSRAGQPSGESTSPKNNTEGLEIQLRHTEH